MTVLIIIMQIDVSTTDSVSWVSPGTISLYGFMPKEPYATIPLYTYESENADISQAITSFIRIISVI